MNESEPLMNVTSLDWNDALADQLRERLGYELGGIIVPCSFCGGTGLYGRTTMYGNACLRCDGGFTMVRRKQKPKRVIADQTRKLLGFIATLQIAGRVGKGG